METLPCTASRKLRSQAVLRCRPGRHPTILASEQRSRRYSTYVNNSTVRNSNKATQSGTTHHSGWSLINICGGAHSPATGRQTSRRVAILTDAADRLHVCVYTRRRILHRALQWHVALPTGHPSRRCGQQQQPYAQWLRCALRMDHSDGTVCGTRR